MKNDQNILLILGASSDIGVALIKRINAEYNRIIAHYNSTSEQLEQLKLELGNKLILVHANFTDEKSTYKLVEAIIDKNIIPTDILHLPSEKGSIKRFSKMTWTDFEKRILISVRSIVVVLNKLLPLMSKRGKGKIIIMLTIHTCQTPLKGCSDYVTEKYALLGLIKALSVEYENRGITVNGISPVAIETRFNSDLPEIVLQQYAAASVSGKNLSVAEILPDIEYLLSDDFTNITGKNFVLDGSGLV
jgi:3-oxoacyl-[acyl-carrier protein] reductase